MFKQRLITTLILVPLVLLTIFFAKSRVFEAILVILVLLAGWEWARLVPLQKPFHKGLFLAGLFASLVLMHVLFLYWAIVGLFIWFGILLAILTFPRSQIIWGYPFLVGTSCFLLLPLLEGSLISLRELPEGKYLIVTVLCLVWAADIGAYLFGKKWGRHKLIPQVSPGKTIEGTFGGILLGLAVAYISYLYLMPAPPLEWFVLSLVTILVSIMGDLFISMLKRRCHVKDTGRLIPGHGGVLDRIDSLIAALPWFYCGLWFISLR